ncbi:MAG: deoxyribodipyrimidine photo-lyase [Alphaproteobacteria bacterium]|nr:deoxyribodipyrimidine photo-lyase [Alphaproteobacteria bacterium]
MSAPSIVWLRRDLRLHDHAALSEALRHPHPMQPVFVFDTDILSRFQNPHDRRLTFLADTLCRLHAQLTARGGGLLLLYGSTKEVMPKLAAALDSPLLCAGEDYEPAAIRRDREVAARARLILVKEHLLLGPKQVKKNDGGVFRVFTPFSKAWRAALTAADASAREVRDRGRYASFAASSEAAKKAGLRVLDAVSPEALLSAIGYRYVPDKLWLPVQGKDRLTRFIGASLKTYKEKRDFPAEYGTSRLSPYLRFGLVSVREAYHAAEGGSDTWINELIWREFYAHILFHFPESATQEFQLQYRALPWRRDEGLLAAWKEGRTGYPIVDAAMRELSQTGWMHNRARMIVASFLTKDLHTDWRLGEAHFGDLLMDYDLASNVGGWQWAASTGTDAQPYFRVFNPVLQGKKFDPEGEYVRRYVPELAALPASVIHEPWKSGRKLDYPTPVVDHAVAREKAIAMFKNEAVQEQLF